MTGSTYQTPLHNIALAVLYLLIPLAAVVMAILFIIAGVIALNRESRSVRHALAIVFGAGTIAAIVAVPVIVSFSQQLPTWAISLLLLGLMIAGYVLFTFYALMLYSFLYQLLPHSKDYKYIIVHGSGLINGTEVPPLLANRLDKAIHAYARLDGVPKIIVSGGRGHDEKISEAKAMKKYLIEKGIDKSSIITEDQSTTILENLRFSKAIIEKHNSGVATLFVTNNYHVFRTSMFAHSV